MSSVSSTNGVSFLLLDVGCHVNNFVELGRASGRGSGMLHYYYYDDDYDDYYNYY